MTESPGTEVVTVADTADALADPGALAAALRGAPISEALAADLVVRASAVVRSYCGWHITGPHEETFVVDGPGTTTVFLPTLALRELISVTEDGAAVPADQVEWSVAGMVRRRDGRCWTERLSGVIVVASHGVDEAPEGVAAVVLALAAKAYANPTSQQSANAGIAQDGFGTDHGPVSLSASERRILDPWRLR